ncbi:MAG: hypothetical protein L3K03_07020 [Thermoplasmata archaeon]|nr:hypothetical protein [Thermoplasmata archaeon]
MTDLSERPPVPPEETGGDERIGLGIAGSLLLLFGIGFCIVTNVALHEMAGAGGVLVGPWLVGHAFGPYGYAAIALGILTSAFGAVLIVLSGRTRHGPFVLPGSTY